MKKIPPAAWVLIVVVVMLLATATAWKAGRRDAAHALATAGDPLREARRDERAEHPSQRLGRVASTPMQPVADDVAQAQSVHANELAAKKQIADVGRDKLVTQYEAETVDAQWAQAKERALRMAATSPQMEEIDAEPSSMEVNCRRTVCRIDAVFPRRLAADDWFTLYTLAAGPEMRTSSMQRTNNPDGTAEVAIYGLAR